VPAAYFLAAHLRSVLTQTEPAPAALDEAVDAVCGPPLPSMSPPPTAPPGATPVWTVGTLGTLAAGERLGPGPAAVGLSPPDQSVDAPPPSPPTRDGDPPPYSAPGPAVNGAAGGEANLGVATDGASAGGGGAIGAAEESVAGSEDGEAALAAVAEAMLLALQVRGPFKCL
jgi:hypothetical protein